MTSKRSESCTGTQATTTKSVTTAEVVTWASGKMQTADRTTGKIGLGLGLGNCPHQHLHFNPLCGPQLWFAFYRWLVTYLKQRS